MENMCVGWKWRISGDNNKITGIKKKLTLIKHNYELGAVNPLHNYKEGIT